MTIRSQISDMNEAWEVLSKIQGQIPNPLGIVWTPSQLFAAIETGKCWSLEVDDRLKALAIFQDRCVAQELQLILVDPSWQRRGLARQLLREALGNIGNHEEIWLEVREANGPARHLYESLGFVQVGTRPKYYTDGSTAILYSRR